MHVLIGTVVGLLVGGGLGYAFRGKEARALVAAGSKLSDVKSVAGSVSQDFKKL